MCYVLWDEFLAFIPIEIPWLVHSENLHPGPGRDLGDDDRFRYWTIFFIVIVAEKHSLFRRKTIDLTDTIWRIGIAVLSTYLAAIGDDHFSFESRLDLSITRQAVDRYRGALSG